MGTNIKTATNTENQRKRILYNIFFIFLVLVLPLVYFPTAQDSSLLSRMLILSAFLLICSAYIYLFSREITLDRNLLKNPVLILGGLYFLMSLLPLAGALNWSEGLFDLVKTGLTLLIIVLAAQLMLTQSGWFARLSEMLIIASFIALMIGLYQYLKLLEEFPNGHLSTGQELIYGITGLMGNKNEYASSLMLLMPFAMYTAITGRGFWRTLAIVSSVLTILMLLILATRAVWLGLFFGGCFIVIVSAIFQKQLGFDPRKLRIVMFASLILVGLITAGAIEGGRFSGSRLLEKLGSIIRPGDDNNHFRLSIWKVTAQMSMDHPVSGVGTGNWQIAIPEYYYRIGLKEKEVNWISPHNDYLWILSEKGIFGICLYLGMIVAAGWLFLQVLRSKADKLAKLQAIFLFAGLTGYLTVACFDFPYQRIDHQVLFALFIAGLIVLYRQQNPGIPKAVNRHYFFIPVILLLVFGLYYSFRALGVETHIKKAESLIKVGKFTDAIAEIDKARTPLRSLDAKGSPVDYYAGQAYDKMNDNPAALSSYQNAINYHPNHIALLNNLGRCYYTAGYYGLAEHYYLKALYIVPGFKEARVNMSTLYYKKGDYQRSLEMLNGIRGARRSPAIKQNINALQRLLGVPVDTLAKQKKHHEKMLKKAQKKKSGKKLKKGE